MEAIELKIWDDECSLCTFYTVHIDGKSKDETTLFFETYFRNDVYKDKAYELFKFITETIGNRHGVNDGFFNRGETHGIHGLPNHGKLKFNVEEIYFPSFPLRLYALKINDSIVVLFNGGIKDARTNQESQLNLKWKEACQHADRINESLRDETITIDNGKLYFYSRHKPIIL